LRRWPNRLHRFQRWSLAIGTMSTLRSASVTRRRAAPFERGANRHGSLDHDWLLQFVQHRFGDPRLISLIRPRLKAGVLDDGVVTPGEMGTPQGGSISVLLSNVYLHYVFDLWFDRVAKPRLRGGTPHQ
jgi:hypothetical protein